MITGYEKPLYILPFDHRHSYITGVFHWQEPLTRDQVVEIVASKQVIYDAFKAAVADTDVRDRAGILVDEAFGAAILRDAAAHAYVTCVSTEKSGQAEFDFEYGDEFARHIEAVNPTFANEPAERNWPGWMPGVASFHETSSNVSIGVIGATSMQFPVKMATDALDATKAFLDAKTTPATSPGLDFTNTGVTLITDQPAAGVDSEDAAWGLQNCWG